MGRKATRSLERERTGKEGEETPPLYEGRTEKERKEVSDEWEEGEEEEE